MDQWFIICALYKWLKWNLKFTMSADLNVFIMSGWIYLYIPVPTLKWKKWIKSNKNWKRSISCTRKLPLLAADEKLKSHIIIIFFFLVYGSSRDFKNQYRINIEDMPSIWKSCQLLCVFLSIKIWGPTTNHCCGSKHWWDNTKYIVYMCVPNIKHHRGKIILLI